MKQCLTKCKAGDIIVYEYKHKYLVANGYDAGNGNVLAHDIATGSRVWFNDRYHQTSITSILKKKKS
jgi:hypothetical protein